MDTNEAIEKTKQFSTTIISDFRPKKVILFGSYAKGNYHEFSDIDIAVIVDKIGDDYLEKLKRLLKLGINVDYRIETVLLEDRDDPAGFWQTVNEEGIVVYSRLSA